MKATFTFLLISIVCLFQCKPAEHAVSTEDTESTANLENTYWKLDKVNETTVVTPENQREVHIVLGNEGDEKKLKGFAGCNSMGGTYTRDGSKIKFTVFTTKMMCEGRMDVENALLSAMNDADNFVINGESMHLLKGTTLLAKFESVYLK